MKKQVLFLTTLIAVITTACTAQNIYTAAGNGTQGYSGDNGQALSAKLNNPTQVATDALGNVYITDFANSKIREINTGGIIFTLAGNGKTGYAGDGGPAVNAELNNPGGIAVDGAGNVYIADIDNNVIRKVDTKGNISTFAGTGTSGFSGDGGAATSAKLAAPNAIAVDASGNVYVSDAGNSRIRIISTTGIITTVAGNGNFAYSGDNGPATAAAINYPYGVAIDAFDNLYIADYVNNRIRKVSGGIISTVAGNGNPGYTGDGGAATTAEINYPIAVAVRPDSNLVYLADGSDNVIRYVDSKGNIHTCAGNGTAGYKGDGGPATAAEFNYPYGIAFNQIGNLFIADQNNNVIRETGGVQGVNELDNSATIGIYPNPSRGVFNIQANSQQLMTNSKIAIYNMSGEEIYSNSTVRFPFIIDLEGCNTGIYILQITGELGTFNKLIEIAR